MQGAVYTAAMCCGNCGGGSGGGGGGGGGGGRGGGFGQQLATLTLATIGASTFEAGHLTH